MATASFTFGPVYEVRTHWGHAGPLSEDGLVVAWFIGLQAVALLLMLRGPRPAASRTGCIALIGLGLLLALSSLWAFDSKTSVMQGAQLLATPLFGLYLWSRPNGVWRMIVLWAGTHIGLVWSARLIWHLEPSSFDHRGNWIGIFLNRNLFTPIAVLGLMTSLALAATWWRSATRGADVVPAAVMTAAVSADLKLALEGGSRASLGFAALTAVVVVVVLTLRRWSPSISAVHVARVIGVALVGVIATGWSLRATWTRAFGDDGDFTGRAIGWEVLLDRWSQRPFHGYGYYSLWESPTFALEQLDAGIRPLIHAHNSYLEILLGAGIVALLLCLVVVSLAWGAGRSSWRGAGVKWSTCGRSSSSRTACCSVCWRPRQTRISCSGPCPSGRSLCNHRHRGEPARRHSAVHRRFGSHRSIRNRRTS